MTEEKDGPLIRKPNLIISAIIIAAVVIIAAFIVASPRSPPPPPPGSADIQMDAVSAKWEQLSIMGARPGAGNQSLWLKVKITNGLDDGLIIAPMAFSVEGVDGAKYNATDYDLEDIIPIGIIPSGASATFNISLEAPSGWVPKTVRYAYGKDVFTDNAPSPAAMILDIVFSNITTTRNDTVLHLSFDLKNQWTKAIDTHDPYFTIVNATNVPLNNGTVNNGPDSVNPGATAHFTIDFEVSASYVPKAVSYDMGLFGPYGSKSM